MKAFTRTLFALAAMQHFTTACPGHLHARQAASTPNPLTVGSDPRAAPATLGYTINHFSLLTNNLDAMVTFYRDVLGLRHIFTYTASPSYTVAYLGYPHGGKNGTGYQTGPELYAEKNNAEGLIELLYNNATETPYTASTKTANTFSHIGLIVPDIAATQRRMMAHNVTILKPSGESIKWGTEGAKAFGFDEAHATRQDARAALQGIAMIGFDAFLLIADPDGNMLEVQQQVPVQAGGV